MSSWAARMHRRAATFGNVVTSCGHPSGPYPRRLEKVKFGVPLEEVCKTDIPGPLLVSILVLVENLLLLTLDIHYLHSYKNDVKEMPVLKYTMSSL